ncbi:hypothetical protein MBT84_26540 [Streptomyces sp. MBT84]|uniref:hypothetical protein n=1 Tax=unclassified Streptomyces TaxID=2593676 RepID=UPI001C6E805D|nr:hypothetical protein [Streptomyces sp. MBT84]MBW8703160.1 hypothetical protein [Streptomyces sp. MBT84]
MKGKFLSVAAMAAAGFLLATTPASAGTDTPRAYAPGGTGWGEFGAYGDKVKVCDTKADNTYIRATVYGPATGNTQVTYEVHGKGNCSTGSRKNLIEGRKVLMVVCAIKDRNTTPDCSPEVKGIA